MIMEEKFRDLLANGVKFYYQDPNIDFSEITDIVLLDDEFLKIELNSKDKYKISINKFKNYHSKDNLNYYNWQEIREFDSLLNEYIY